MKAPRACAREASHAHGGKNLKIQPPKGLGGNPNCFSSPQTLFFVSINSVQNFKIVAQPLLGEKFVWWWVVVVVVVVCKPILVFRFGPNPALGLRLGPS